MQSLKKFLIFVNRLANDGKCELNSRRTRTREVSSKFSIAATRSRTGFFNILVHCSYFIVPFHYSQIQSWLSIIPLFHYSSLDSAFDPWDTYPYQFSTMRPKFFAFHFLHCHVSRFLRLLQTLYYSRLFMRTISKTTQKLLK